MHSLGDNVLLSISSVSVSCLRLSDVVFVFLCVFPSLSSVSVFCLPFLISLKLLDMRLSGTRKRTGDFVVCSAILVGVRLLRSSRIWPSLYVAHMCAGRPSS